MNKEKSNVSRRSFPRPLPAQAVIRLKGQPVPYFIKPSARARYLRMEIRRETGLTIVVPHGYALDTLPDLLRKRASWILGGLVKIGATQAAEGPQGLKNGDSVPYLGRDLRVVVRPVQGNMNSVKLAKDSLVVDLTCRSRLDLVLEQWYRMQAARIICGRTDRLCARMRLRYSRLSIRGQKTRWGSCSQKGNLSFNWKLAMAPEPVIDYVIVHELAHLEQMNHTRKFWALVDRHCPSWQEHRKWLKDHEMELAGKLSP